MSISSEDTVSQHSYDIFDKNAASVPSIIAKVVTQYGAEIALASWSETITYNELNKRSNQLAHYLSATFLAKDCILSISGQS